MSDCSSESSDGIAFDDRTTSTNFQERLLQAKSTSLSNDTRFPDFYESDDTAILKAQLDRLTKKVFLMENRVFEKENKLTARREKRNEEAGITNMTTEERAAYFERQEKRQEDFKKTRQQFRKKLLSKELKHVGGGDDADDDQEQVEEDDAASKQDELLLDTQAYDKDETPDWDVVYEYLLLLESESMDDGLSFGADIINPNAEMRQKALASEQVKKQTVYSGIVIKNSTHYFTTTTENDQAETGDVRHCVLSGTSFDLPFKVEFEVLEPSGVMTSMDFELNIEMLLAVGNTLQRIKNECNIMGFFQLLVHYAKFENGRKHTFDQLIHHYKDTPVNVMMLSQTKLQFEGAVECGINLLLSWKISETNTDRERLDANVNNDVKPKLTMEAVALPTVIARDTNRALDRVDEAFMHAIMKKGVFEGTKYIVDNILAV